MHRSQRSLTKCKNKKNVNLNFVFDQTFTICWSAALPKQLREQARSTKQPANVFMKPCVHSCEVICKQQINEISMGTQNSKKQFFNCRQKHWFKEFIIKLPTMLLPSNQVSTKQIGQKIWQDFFYKDRKQFQKTKKDTSLTHFSSCGLSSCDSKQTTCENGSDERFAFLFDMKITPTHITWSK